MAKRETQKTAGRGAKPMGGQEMPSAGTAVAERPQAGKTGHPTHDQIAKRALEIWMQHGCPPGEDKKNWFEAERQLKEEMRSR